MYTVCPRSLGLYSYLLLNGTDECLFNIYERVNLNINNIFKTYEKIEKIRKKEAIKLEGREGGMALVAGPQILFCGFL